MDAVKRRRSDEITANHSGPKIGYPLPLVKKRMYVQSKMSGQTTILTFAVAIFVGSALKDFFNTLTRDLVAPFIAALLPGAQQTLEKITIQLGPIKINIGEVISATLTLAIALLVVSYTLPYLREYSPVRGGSK